MSIFSWDYDDYNLFTLWRGHNPSTVRKEYSRLRSIANKRVQRIYDKGYISKSHYDYLVGRFRTIAKLGSDRAVRTSLVDVFRFLNWGGSTISGQIQMAKDYITEMKETYKIDWIDMDNYRIVQEFFGDIQTDEFRYKVSIEFLRQLKTVKETAQDLRKEFEKWYLQKTTGRSPIKRY